MARGSDGGTAQGGTATQSIEIMGSGGSVQNTGRYVLRKKYLVSNETDLIKPPSPPEGFKATSISWQKIGGNYYEQTVDFESFVSSEQTGVVEKQGSIEGRFELDVQDELVPIAAHPNLPKIVEEYNGKIDENTNKVTFPPKYTPKTGGGTAEKKSNPMFGKLYFTRPSATFRHIQQMQSIPADIWNNVGKKVSKLPADFPHPPDFVNDKGENQTYYWIVLSPQIYRRGNAYEVVRTYKLSDPNAPDEVYAKTEPDTKKT